MTKITLHTKKYAKELNTCTRPFRHDKNGRTNTITLTLGDKAQEIITTILHMLHMILMQENVVYKQSPRLMEIARGLEGSPVYNCDRARLEEFFQRCDTLYIDGYITFCMDEYREKLDLVLYTIIKRINSAK